MNKRRHWKWGFSMLTAMAFFILALGGGSDMAAAVLGAQPDPAAELSRAWQRAQATGSYHFTADIVQTKTPLATIENVGRQSAQDRLYVQGQTHLHEQKLEMMLWAQGGSVVDESSGVQLRVEGDEAYVRQGDESWQPVDDFTGLFAPEGDFMTYLAAVSDVVDLGLESRGGFSFNRYAFVIDGPAYAAYVRDQMQEQLAKSGELPPGVRLDLPKQYAQMTGNGELWVDADGLPVRQVLQLQLPDQEGAQISAEVTVDFSEFGSSSASPTAAWPGATVFSALDLATGQAIIAQRLAALSAFVVVLALFWFLLQKRSKTVYAATMFTVIAAMVLSPILQSAGAQAFSERQAARAAQEEDSGQPSAMQRALDGLQNSRLQVPAGALAMLQDDDGRDMDGDGLTDVEERFLGTDLGALAASIAGESSLTVELPPDDGVDSDFDGLTDYTEALLGTLPDMADSDGDGVSDRVELEGFTYNGRTWYGDPLNTDTNGDGIDDGREWLLDLDNDGIPDDTDGDGVPDLFDPDNDGDGVPDDIDLSPATKLDTIFSAAEPMELQLDNLERGRLTYAEFQLRPTDPDHLWYAFNVLDWPAGDRQGTIQDDDGLTFADLNDALPLSPNANGDMRLVPMLELRISDSTTHLPDDATLANYGIAVQPLPDDQTAVYVPLQLTQDSTGGEHVAFYGKMLYLPQGDQWGAAHQARLVWAVQALVDVCAEFSDGLCSEYSMRNEMQVIHTYDDDWRLTGFNVRENRVTELALVYEDPAVDEDVHDDGALWKLTHGLEATFLAGRTDLVSASGIFDRFNHTTNDGVSLEERWGLPDTLSVSYGQYSHLDAALMTTAITETKRVLDTAFTPALDGSGPITPTLLFAREDRYRSFNLDAQGGPNADLITLQDGQITFNLRPDRVTVNTMTGVNWAPFQYDDGAWTGSSIEEYWNELARRYGAEFSQAYSNADEAGGALGLAQTYYVALYRGVVNVVESGDLILQRHYYSTDKLLAARIAGSAQSGAMFVTRILASNLIAPSVALKWFNTILRDYKTFRIANPLATLGEGLTALYRQFYFWWQTSRLTFGLAMAATVTVAAAVAVGGYYLVQAYISDAPGARIATAVMVGAIAAYLGVIAPVLAMRDMVNAIVKVKQVSTLAALRTVALASGEINMASRVAATVGLVISLGIIWGVFMYAVFSSDIPPGSIAFNMLLAQAIAATILAILMFVVSLTIVGAIIVAIISVIDLILNLLGVGFTISGWVTEFIAGLIYHFELTVDSDVQTGAFDMELFDPARGLVAGNIARVSLPITTTITHATPGTRVRGDLNEFYSVRNLLTTTFQYRLNEGPGALSATRSEMRWDWFVVPDRTISSPRHTLYRGTNVANPALNVTLSAGVNVSLPVHLTSAYALPGVDCWTILVYVDCSHRTIAGSNDVAVGEALVLDVLPATLDEFYALDWGGPAPFDVQKDHDGDGLLARAHGGADPDDSVDQCNGGLCWDTDGDGLSDRYELALRSLGVQNGGSRISPLSIDTDADGLCDADEIRLGTRPDMRDTDGDGLTDGQEVWRQDRCDANGNGDTDEWIGGWDFTTTFTGADGTTRTLTTRISSNPLSADEDRDGLTDLAEKTLHELDPEQYPYHPRVFNETPLGLYVVLDDEDGVVSPGQTVVVTTTVQNNLSAELYALGGLTVTLPTVLGGDVLTRSYNLGRDEATSLVAGATVSAGSSVQATVAGAFSARLHNGATDSTWAWDPPRLSQDTNLTGVYPRQATLSALYGADADYAVASLESTLAGSLAHGGIEYGDAKGRQGDRQLSGAINLSPAPYGLSGDAAPALASNNMGETLAVWPNAHWYDCTEVELIDISVITQGDQSGGSEYYIVRTNPTNSTDWNRTFGDAFSTDGTRLWTDPVGNRGNGAEIPIGVTTTLCEGDSIAVWEDDGDGLLADDFICNFFPFGHPNLIGHVQTIHCSDEADTYLQLDMRVIADPGRDWLQRGNENCAEVNLATLDVINATDQSGGAEYYINLNGHHTVTPVGGSNPAAGTRIWTAAGSANNGDILQLGVTVKVCRGDTLDVWEDDGGSGDDYICSLPMLEDTPPTAQSEGNPITFACNGFDSDPTQLRLHYTVMPNPIHTIAATIVTADGTIKHDGLLLQERSVDYTQGLPTYRSFGRPAVASDGANFLVAWHDDFSRFHFLPVTGAGTPGAKTITGAAGNPPANLDLAWVGTRYIAVYEAGANVELRFVEQDGSSQGTLVVANSSLHEFAPRVAYNSTEDEALIVYVVRVDSSTYSVRGRFVQGSSLSPEFVIGALATQPSPPFFFDPGAAVAYDAANNTWLVAWSFFNLFPLRDEIHYRALAADGAPLLPEEVVAISSDMNPRHLSLACSDANAVAPNCAFLTHSDPHAGQQRLRMDQLFLRSVPPWLGEIDGAAAAQLVVDADAPTSALVGLENNQRLSIAGSLTIGGEANDPTSNIALVEVSINGGDWQPAQNKESWQFSWTPDGDGAYTIRTRATDIVGNVETPSDGVTIHVDNAPPQITTGNPDNPIVGATQDAQNRWRVVLDGTAADAAGVASVEVLVTPNGAGWQPATLVGNNWTVDYLFPLVDAGGNAMTDVTAAYTLLVRATDGAGNQTAAGDLLQIPFRVDATAPAGALLDPHPSTTTITQPLTLSGVITDAGSIAAGVQGLEIDFVPSGTDAITNTWQATTLIGGGPGATTAEWQFDVAAGLEGNYLINLRGTDVLGNRDDDPMNWWSGWQGEIDTRAPRAVITMTYEGAGLAARTNVSAWIQDLNLTESGLSMTANGEDIDCDIQAKDRTYLPHVMDEETARLYELRPECILNGILDTPVTLRVLDVYGHETVVMATLPAATVQSLNLDAPPIASTVLTPTHESALGATAAVSITGGAYAIDYLKALTLTVEGATIFATSWPSNTITNTLWSTTWTPPAEGIYELVSLAEDWSGALQTQLQPAVVTVDTQAPAINFGATVLTTTHQLSAGRVELSGTVSDTVGVEEIVISTGGTVLGNASFGASVPSSDGRWRFAWNLGADPDGALYQVTAEARDAAHSTAVTQTITVDLAAPSMVTPTLAYINTAGDAIPTIPGHTVRDGATLRLDWTASQDGSGIGAYYAGWTNSLTPTRSLLTAYPPDARQHEATVPEASAWLAHVLTLDTHGNPISQTVGPPLYVDAPTTPDYISTDDGLGVLYRGWMESGCTQIGANRELARNAPGATTLDETAVQKMYLSWDAGALRMVWAGADWDVDGDLFIYLDTQSGGATAAYNPYGSPATIHLPDGLGADYLIYVEDAAAAQLLRWDGGAWLDERALSAPNHMLDVAQQPAITDLYLPFDWLGSPSSLKLVALASEEDALRAWAAMPHKNPLNSSRAVSSLATPYLDRAFTLTQHYEWSAPGAAGVCPAAGQFEDADLHATLVSDPPGVQVGYLQHDLPGLTPPGSHLDGDLDGEPDAAGLPLDSNPAPIGQGQTVSYTLHIANAGAADAGGVLVTLTARGGLEFPGTSQVIDVGTLEAGAATALTFSATVNTSLHGESGEIGVVVSDAIHGPFDWLWVQHDIDTAGPQDVNIVAPLNYIGPFANAIQGVVSDRSPVPTIILREQGGVTQTCTDPTPANGEWVCNWDAGGAADGTVFHLRASATDVWGNSGSFGPLHTLTVDAVAPAIALSAETESALADGRLDPDELGLRGEVTDDRAAAQAEVCASDSDVEAPMCIVVDVTPAAEASGHWFAKAPLDSSLDGAPVTLTFAGIDIAGNRSQPLTVTVQADLRAPQIELLTFVPLIGQHTTVTALGGTAVDGSGIETLNLRLTRPDTSFSIVPLTLSGENWSYEATFDLAGVYHAAIEAVDTFGNRRVLGSFDLNVISAGVNVPPVVNLAPGYVVEEGSTIVLDANASDVNGDPLSYAWDLDNDGEFDDGATATVTFDATNLDGPSSHIVSVQVTDSLSDPVTASTTVTVVNVAPQDIILDLSAPEISENETVSLSGSFAGSGSDTHSVLIDWGDGLTNTLDLAATEFTFGPLEYTYPDDDPSGTPADVYLIAVTVTDSDGGANTSTVPLTVRNVPPVLSNVAVADSDENTPTTLSGNIEDLGVRDSFTLLVDWGDGSTPEVFSYAAGTTAFSETHRYLDDDPPGTPSDAYTVYLTLRDDDGGQTELSTTATVNNLSPVVEVNPLSQTGQYSDYIGNVTISGTDTIGDPLTISTAWGVDGVPELTPGLPPSLTLENGSCLPGAGQMHICRWLLSGAAQISQGSYDIIATITDDDTGQSSPITTTLLVTPEDAQVRLDEANPVAVAVTGPGSDASLPFTLNLEVQEAPESGTATAPGNINLAEVQVTLVPVGPGSTVTGQCAPVNSAPAYTYEAVLTVQCEFAGIPVNAYTIQAQVDGGYYTGTVEGALVVYDPSLGFVTGGGWFYWPGTADRTGGYAGDRTQIDLKIRYDRNGSIQPKITFSRRLRDGTVHQFESGTVAGMAIGPTGNPNMAWAAISGTVTYLAPGWQQPATGYRFLLYLEDRGQPGPQGEADHVWLQLKDGDGNIVADLSMSLPPTENGVPIAGGDIVIQ